MPLKQQNAAQNEKPSKMRRRQKTSENLGSHVDKNGGSSNIYSVLSNDTVADFDTVTDSETPMDMASNTNIDANKSSTRSNSRNLPNIRDGVPQIQQTTNSSDQQCPLWAAQLISDVRDINHKLSKLDSIEKTLNCLSVNVHDLDEKVSTMDTRLTYVEGACSFISDKYETQKHAIESTNATMLEMKQKCEKLECNVATLVKEKHVLEERITNTESRSMRENLLFHGIAETEGENCTGIVKQFCKSELKLNADFVDKVIIDRAHRIGKITRTDAQNQQIRPIVVKFHKYSDKEHIRESAYAQRVQLEERNVSIRDQWPQSVLEKRRALYPILEQERTKGYHVKLVRDKLFINGNRYEGQQQLRVH